MKTAIHYNGEWNQEANNIYNEIFNIDLLHTKCMKLHDAFDPFLVVTTHECSMPVIHENFNRLLPKCKLRRSVITGESLLVCDYYIMYYYGTVKKQIFYFI
jgi:hypothetical protein